MPKHTLRPIYIISYPSHQFPAHHSLWIPHHNPTTQKASSHGKELQVDGDPLNGFEHKFSGNVDLEASSRAYTLHLIGWTEGVSIVDDGDVDGDWNGSDGRDVFEIFALEIPPPRPSLRSSAGSSVFIQAPTRVRIRNCQTWLRDYVVLLVRKGLLEPDALEKLDAVPKN